MATNLRGLCRLNISLANNAFFKYNFINVGVRCMYTERDLGVTLYENTRFMFRNQFMTIENVFRDKMREICQDENGVVYTEDLKAMIHLVQDDEKDMELLNDMLKKYVQNQEEKKFGKYIFGPVVMRMYYHLNQPQYALEVFHNDAMNESFNYRSTCRILLSLLYKNNMYKEMREAYQKIFDMKGLPFIGTCNVLIYAGCLKENTPESVEFALNLWKHQQDITKPSIRSCALVSYLMLKNGKPEMALDVLGSVPLERISSLRSLKVLAYMHLERYIQIIPILRFIIEQSINNNRRYSLFSEVVCELEDRLKTENVEEGKQLVSLLEQIKQQDCIQSNMTLEEFILKPMAYSKHQANNSRYVEDKMDVRNRESYQLEKKSELKNYL